MLAGAKMTDNAAAEIINDTGKLPTTRVVLLVAQPDPGNARQPQ